MTHGTENELSNAEELTPQDAAQLEAVIEEIIEEIEAEEGESEGEPEFAGLVPDSESDEYDEKDDVD